MKTSYRLAVLAGLAVVWGGGAEIGPKVFSYTRISWTKGPDGSIEPIFNTPNGAPRPSPMQFHWGQWMLDGAFPRYIGFGN